MGNTTTTTTGVKTLYARNVEASTLTTITNNFASEGFKNRGEFVNVLLKEGLKAYKAKKKVTKKKKATKKKVTKKAK